MKRVDLFLGVILSMPVASVCAQPKEQPSTAAIDARIADARKRMQVIDSTPVELAGGLIGASVGALSNATPSQIKEMLNGKYGLVAARKSSVDVKIAGARLVRETKSLSPMDVEKMDREEHAARVHSSLLELELFNIREDREIVNRLAAQESIPTSTWLALLERKRFLVRYELSFGEIERKVALGQDPWKKRE
jgi:hypothetical protein